MSKKYDFVDWYCDGCDAHLNRQDGFTTATGSWTCTECGYENDVTDDNILDEDEDLYQEECPNCGGHMRRATYAWNTWICEDCGTEAVEDEFGLLLTEIEEE